MRRILFISPTHEEAKQRFLKAIDMLDAKNAAVRIVHSQMLIEFRLVTYEFISASNDLDCKLRGREFDGIIVDELVDLTEHQRVQIKVIVKD